MNVRPKVALVGLLASAGVEFCATSVEAQAPRSSLSLPTLPTFAQIALHGSSPLARSETAAERSFAPGRQPSRVEPPRNVKAALQSDDGDEDDEDEHEAPYLPGKVNQKPVKIPEAIPSVRQKRTSLGPHLEPIREFEITERATLGIIGQADRIGAKFGAPISAERLERTGMSALRVKDAGVGLSLEFKLGK